VVSSPRELSVDPEERIRWRVRCVGGGLYVGVQRLVSRGLEMLTQRQ